MGDILPTHKLSTYIVLECHNGLAVDIASVTLGDRRNDLATDTAAMSIRVCDPVDAQNIGAGSLWMPEALVSQATFGVTSSGN